MGGWMGGWWVVEDQFDNKAISAPSLAGVGAWAELGNSEGDWHPAIAW